jgi:hypothetical protein
MFKLFLLLWSLAQVGPVVPPVVTIASALSFDVAATDTNGDPISLASYTVAVSSAPDLNVAGAAALKTQVGTMKAAGGTTVANLSTLMVGLPVGNYTLSVQVQDSKGNKSAWSTGLGVAKMAGVPLFPTNLKITVTVGGY